MSNEKITIDQKDLLMAELEEYKLENPNDGKAII